MTTGKMEKKEFMSGFWRSCCLQGCFNYERQQGLGFGYAMIPHLRRIYKDDPEGFKEAMKRHLVFYNITPQCTTFVQGIAVAMEEEAASNPDFDASSINAIKTALMGPLSGIGDSIFQSTWRVISMGVGLSLAAGGNILGPIVFLLMYNIPSAFVRFLGPYVGYSLGAKFMSSAAENGIMSFITKAASTVGLMTVGAMTATMVSCNIGFVFTMGGAEQSIQAMLDTIFPNLLPLLLTLFCFKLLNKKVNATLLIFGLMVFAILGTWIGIF